MTGPAGDVEGLSRARERVIERIAAACARAGRDPLEVTLVAVSKTVPAVRLRAAADAGLDIFGENRVQEAAAKIPKVPGARWHLVGPLQSNKAGAALQLFQRIETVHSVELARRLDRILGSTPGRDPYPVLLQVNVDGDPAKFGFMPDELQPVLEALDACRGLDFRGLMTVGRQVERPEDARRTFAGLRQLAGSLRAGWSRLGPELSMGMSDDFEVAVEEGATTVRVGRALFGERH